jgi:hypothetical protein
MACSIPLLARISLSLSRLSGACSPNKIIGSPKKIRNNEFEMAQNRGFELYALIYLALVISFGQAYHQWGGQAA